MTGRDEAAVGAVIAAATERLRDGGPGRLFVSGPAGSGKSAVLAALAAEFPAAVLVDAAGRSSDSVVQELIERTGRAQRRPEADLIDLVLALRKEREPRILLVANVDLAGSLTSGGEPAVLQAVLASLRIPATEGPLRLVVEQVEGPELPDTSSSKYEESVLNLPSGPGADRVRALTEEAPAEALGALRALAWSQLRRVPVHGWAALCRAAEVPFDVHRLAEWAAQLPWLVQEEDGSVRFADLALAADLRRGAPDVSGLHSRMTDALLAGEPADDWAVRSLPGHAVAAGRFDDLLADASALARVPQDALLEGFRAGYRQGIPNGTPAAALHFVSGYGLAGAPHGEWVAWLAHDAFTRGEFARAEELASACPEPLPFRTVWSQWRPAGDFTPPVPPGHLSDLEYVAAAEFRGELVVLTVDEDDVRVVRDAGTGEPLPTAAVEADLVELPDEAADLSVRPRWRYTTVRDAEARTVGVFHHPDAGHAGAVGDLLVLADRQGAYAVRLDTDRLRQGPDHRLVQLISGHQLLPRPFDPAAVADLRGLLERTFGPERVHRLAEDEVPTGITHEPTRRLLTAVGVPSVEGLIGLWLEPAAGLEPRTWESTSDAEQPAGSGPFHLVGEWMGAPLVLDGADGRVLRMIPPNSPKYTHPREPLAGSSLESFVTMVALQQRYLQVHRTGGPDRYDVLAELQLQLTGVDQAAAALDCWQYVLEPDNWG
ncbi:SUKH-4 family immunity protein [Kitasatospora sp. P5_F3]